MDKNKCTSRHNIVKSENTGDKEKIIKGHKFRENKKQVSDRGSKIRIVSSSTAN